MVCTNGLSANGARVWEALPGGAVSSDGPDGEQAEQQEAARIWVWWGPQTFQCD